MSIARSVQVIAGERMLIVAGERRRPTKPGRVYQQMEIEVGPFQRQVRLAEDVDPSRARASLENGVLTIELPVAEGAPPPGRVTIEVWRTGGDERRERHLVRDAGASSTRRSSFPAALPVLPLKETVVFPQSMSPLAIGQERSVRLIDDVVSGDRLLALVTATRRLGRRARLGRPLRGRAPSRSSTR